MLPRSSLRRIDLQCPLLTRILPPCQPKGSFLQIRLRRDSQFYYRRFTICNNQSSTLQKSTISVTTFILLSVTAVLSGSLIAYFQSSRPPDDSKNIGYQNIDQNQTMAGVIPPGRPGNLTPDQEAKLRELWKATLNVFGVIHNSRETGESLDGNPARDSLDETATPDKKKKKRLGLFGRKKDKDTDTANGVYKESNDSEDKYGQTKEFHDVLATQSPEDLRKAFWSMVKHDHPDGLLLRFLRARKWDVEKALIMLISTMHWRSQEMHVDDDVMKNGEGVALAETLSSDPSIKKEGDDFLQQLRMGKSYLHGSDKDGRPMCFVRVRLHKQGEQSEDSVERITVHVIETARLLLLPPVDTAAIVFDMTGFSMANMDYGPVKFMIKCFEANYPESLGVVLVHNAPWVFQGIWTIIKGWLDPVVASKIHFTKHVDGLGEFVPKDHIPKELGGDDPFVYSYLEPVPGENDKMKDDATKNRLLEERSARVKNFEAVTQEWIKGSTTDNELMQERNSIAGQLRKDYWRLDPYVRARSQYDRSGMIQEGGAIEYYPSKKSILNPPVTNGPTPAGHNPNDLD